MAIKDLVPKIGRGREHMPVRREEHEPFRDFQRQMNRLFDDFFSDVPLAFRWGERGLAAAGFNPRVDVSETDKEVKVSAELPGMDEKDITVEMDDAAITIRGERKEEKEDKGKNWYTQGTVLWRIPSHRSSARERRWREGQRQVQERRSDHHGSETRGGAGQAEGHQDRNRLICRLRSSPPPARRWIIQPETFTGVSFRSGLAAMEKALRRRRRKRRLAFEQEEKNRSVGRRLGRRQRGRGKNLAAPDLSCFSVRFGSTAVGRHRPGLRRPWLPRSARRAEPHTDRDALSPPESRAGLQNPRWSEAG